MLTLGKKVFESKVHRDINCSKCHGKDGILTDDVVRDIRNHNSESNRHGREKQKLKDWTDTDWFDSVSNVIPDTEMDAWLELYPPHDIWLGIVYAKHFSKSK